MDLIPPTQRFRRRNSPEENTGRLKIRRGSERECVCTCMHVWLLLKCRAVMMEKYRKTRPWRAFRMLSKVDLEAQEISGDFAKSLIVLKL